MSKKTQQKQLGFINYDSHDSARDKVAQLKLVDVGLLKGYAEANRALVQLLIPNQVGELGVVEAEVFNDGLIASPPGSPCILIYPLSPVFALLNQQLAMQGKSFDDKCAKCIILSKVPSSEDVSFSRMGNSLALTGSSWSLLFDPSQVSFSSDSTRLLVSEDIGFRLDLAEGKVCIEVDGEGNIVSGAGYSYDVQNKVFNWLSRIQQKSDGSLSIEGAGSVDDSNESFGQNNITLGADGSISIKAGVAKDATSTVDISCAVDGTIIVSSLDAGEAKSTVVLASDGSITATGETVNITANSGCTITGDVTLDGAVNITGDVTSDGAVNIGGDLTVDGAITNGNLESPA